MNESTHKYFNKLKFPISVGIFPEMSFECKSLNICGKNKNDKYDFFAKNKIDFLHLFVQIKMGTKIYSQILK